MSEPETNTHADAERYATRLKIGLVVPSTNTTLEPDGHALCPPGVTCHTGRILIRERKIGAAKAYDEHVQAMRDGIADAAERVLTCGPQHLIMGVALEAFWGGVAGSQRLQQELEDAAGVPVTIGSVALHAALQRFGAQRIAVLTPHLPAGDEQVRAWFEESGYQIVNFLGLKCQSPRQIALVTAAQMRNAIAELDGPEVDAIVQVGTNLQFLPFAAAAEQLLGKPVLAINAAMGWHALRQHGINDRIAGLGRLLNEY